MLQETRVFENMLMVGRVEKTTKEGAGSLLFCNLVPTVTREVFGSLSGEGSGAIGPLPPDHFCTPSLRSQGSVTTVSAVCSPLVRVLEQQLGGGLEADGGGGAGWPGAGPRAGRHRHQVRRPRRQVGQKQRGRRGANRHVRQRPRPRAPVAAPRHAAHRHLQQRRDPLLAAPMPTTRHATSPSTSTRLLFLCGSCQGHWRAKAGGRRLTSFEGARHLGVGGAAIDGLVEGHHEELVAGEGGQAGDFNARHLSGAQHRLHVVRLRGARPVQRPGVHGEAFHVLRVEHLSHTTQLNNIPNCVHGDQLNKVQVASTNTQRLPLGNAIGRSCHTNCFITGCFLCHGSAGRCALVGGFSRGSPFSPSLTFSAASCPRHFTLAPSAVAPTSRRSRGVVVARLLVSHLSEPGSILGGVTPLHSHVGIMPGDGAGQRVFFGDLPFPTPFHSGAAPHSHRFTLGQERVKSRPSALTEGGGRTYLPGELDGRGGEGLGVHKLDDALRKEAVAGGAESRLLARRRGHVLGGRRRRRHTVRVLGTHDEGVGGSRGEVVLRVAGALHPAGRHGPTSAAVGASLALPAEHLHLQPTPTSLRPLPRLRKHRSSPLYQHFRKP
ncbi:hypothetical protein PR048_016947 [Dryococelus australis]|uniref:Uncharacterized protein n=1 Tax=Dryococelus australis TaxID=614101 RepID=A0ABQ9H870_9NEOP|nr:hypothetical protein PR048_016947 [Dryococelus australis]